MEHLFALFITLLIYLLIFAILYHVLLQVMVLLEFPVKIQNISKALLLVLLLFFLWALVAGAEWLPRLPEGHR